MDQYQNNHQYHTGYVPLATTKKRNLLNKNVLFSLAIVLLLGTLGVTSYLYYSALQENKELKESSVAGTSTDQEVTKVVENLKKLVEIDPNEKLNIEKVTNIEKFTEQDPEFYKNLQIDQYVVVLPDSQRLLIFDAKLNKIMNFSNYTLNVEIIPEDKIATTEKPFYIEIYTTSSVTNQQVEDVKSALTKLSSNYIIKEVKQALKTDYQGVQVVLLNTKNKPSMSQNFLGHVGTNKISEKMPDGETASTADGVIILGYAKDSGK